jgi:hypothetical protein
MKTPFSRISEVVLSLGIPAVAYVATTNSIESASLIPGIFFSLLGAWHVIVVNDDSFASRESLGSFFLAKKHFIPKLAAPALVAASFAHTPLLATVILGTIISWDIYSLYGKNDWRFSLVFNFIGGAAHFLIGVACASGSFAEFVEFAVREAPETIFFAFAMVAGAMHHEAYDVEEDRVGGYATGAVKFSPDRWWRLASLPMMAAVISLFSADSLFRNCFLVATGAYFAFYSVFALSAVPSRKTGFRVLCRFAFILAAAVFAYFKTSR